MENIRPPDKVKRERLISHPQSSDEEEEDEELKKILEESLLEESLTLTKKKDDEEMKKIIEESIQEYIEREKEVRKNEMNELTTRAKKLAHQDTTWAKILEMTNNYIENAETTIVSEEEYKKIKENMDQLYTIPKSKNRKTAISQTTYDLVSVISCLR
jgi:hypothetical protein